MSNPKHHLREAIISALPDIAQQLPVDCELFVIAVRPGESDFDLVLPSPEANLNNALDALRRQGLGINGDNAYKRDLLDTTVGALALGAQNTHPPPANHWAQRFWDIGREERAQHEALIEAALTFLYGLKAQIDRASADGQPVPVFDGMSELHEQIKKAIQ